MKLIFIKLKMEIKKMIQKIIKKIYDALNNNFINHEEEKKTNSR